MLSSLSLRLILDEVTALSLLQAEAYEKERVKAEEKRMKKLEDAFFSMLKKAMPPIEPHDHWEDVR